MKQKRRTNRSERGVSIPEILVVVVIIGILGAITAMSFRSAKKYNAENQALLLIDLIREAQQRAFSQKKTMRLEINSTDRTVRIVNENEPADTNNDGTYEAPTTNNDTIVKTAAYTDANVYVGVVPTNLTGVPTELSPVNAISFAASAHPLSTGKQVAVMRFRSNGTVHNAGDNATGSNSAPTGATIHVWSKRDSDTSANPTVADIYRAVTVLGSSGSAKMWKCGTKDSSNQCTAWVR